MSYTKQTWVNGDVITDTKLNHMEDGIAEAGGGNQIEFLHLDKTAYPMALDKTYGEIKALLDAGKDCRVIVSDAYNDQGGVLTAYCNMTFTSDGDGSYLVAVDDSGVEFAWGAADEYPTEGMD